MNKFYYNNGKLKQEQNYKNDKREGISKGYYESGKLWSEWNFKNGKLEGISKGYYESGGIAYIDTYKNGKKINRKTYTEQWQLKLDQEYPQ